MFLSQYIDILNYILFFLKQIISYFLLSGSAAGFGATEDLHRIFKAEELPLKGPFKMD
jgi:hypothetical protein